jgi:hypothetical protein
MDQAQNQAQVPVVPEVPPNPPGQVPVAPVNNPAGHVQVPMVQAIQGANGGINLKVEKAKLPEFYGQKDKDSIAAAEFAKRIDWNMSANGWTDEEAYSNFGMALCGSANIWLESMITLQKIKGDRERWSIIKPFFKSEFTVKTDDKLILDGLAHMAMRQTENVRDYFGRLNKTNNIIMEGEQSYTLLPPKPVPQANGFLDIAEVNAYYETRDEAIGEFYLLNFFLVGLPSELKRVINLQSLDELELYTAVKLATVESRSREEAKSLSRIYVVEDDSEDAVDAINFRQQKGSAQRAGTSLSVATTTDHQTQATGATPTPGETLINKIKVTMQTGTSRFASSARSLIIAKRNVAKESTPTNHVSTPVDAHSGRRSMLL